MPEAAHWFQFSPVLPKRTAFNPPGCLHKKKTTTHVWPTVLLEKVHMKR